MKNLFLLFLAAAIALAAAPCPAADERAEAEIDYLISRVESSGILFIRNGKEYGPGEAAGHLRAKRSHFSDRIRSAEDFIELAGTKSLATGKPYFVKTGGGKIEESSRWLTDELKRHRRGKGKQAEIR